MKVGLDVDDGSAVDRFEWSDFESALRVELEDSDFVQADRVRTVGGARGEDSGEPTGGVVARMSSERVAMSEMKPGKDEDLRTCGDPINGFKKIRENLQPGSGTAFVSLSWSVASISKLRSDNTNGMYLVEVRFGHSFSRCAQ